LTTFSDTTKRDWGLVIAGILALGLFFWLYSEFHPLSMADSGLGETMAAEQSNQRLLSMGYSSDLQPFTRYRVNQALLDSLQHQTDFSEFYATELNRSLYPVFYWESIFHIEPLPQDMINIGGRQARTIRFHLDEKGELLGMYNELNLLPKPGVDIEALSFALDTIPLIEAPIDSTIYQRLVFTFLENELQNDFRNGINLSERTYLGRNISERMARFHVIHSSWPADEFVITGTEKVTIGNIDAARITFTKSDNPVRQYAELAVTVLPTGTLTSFEYSFREDMKGSINMSELKSNVRNGLILLAVFWILILVFIRFRMRLIDMRAAILFAVLAGFIFPFMTVMEVLFQYLNSFGELNLSFILPLFLIVGVVAAFTSILFFLVTAIADSITRQHWSSKLRTVDLIRTGYFITLPVGLTFIRGISYSFIIVAVWALLLFNLPGGFISLESTFFGNERYLPNIVMVLSNMVWYFIISQAIFLIFLGQLRNISKSAAVPILVCVVIFALVNPFAINMGPLGNEFVVLGSVGLIVGVIYLIEDYLTVFIALFFTAGTLYSASGWLIDPSPDSTIFYTHILIIVAGFTFGAYSIWKGKSLQELPTFVPEYIEDLAQEERIKQELQIARTVQQSFLPESTPNFPGLDIAAICKPAHETGGDYYDFIELDDERLAVAIGDVSGKGIQAAFYMTFTKGVLHAICEEFKSTIEVLTKTNNLFRKNAKRGTFVSLIFGVVDLKSNIFKFSRAGHNPLLYFNSKEKKLHEYRPPGIGVGMANGDIFSKNISEQSIEFQKNDLLIMFTDGVVEATNNMDSFYGDERLHKIIIRNNELSAEALLEKILKDLNDFGENSNQHDDMTMLIIKKR
jgi:sigma-B regulation protein RsbU (phosphoserine phosphatase)